MEGYARNTCRVTRTKITEATQKSGLISSQGSPLPSKHSEKSVRAHLYAFGPKTQGGKEEKVERVTCPRRPLRPASPVLPPCLQTGVC